MSVSAVSKASTPGLHGLRQWFTSPLGNYALSTESAMLEQLLPGFLGYHLVQFSIQNRPLFHSSQMHHKLCVGLDDLALNGLVAAPGQLPFARDVIDLVLVHHLLDYVESPQELLREAARITLPMGHLVIIGFNPSSLWGAWWGMTRFIKTPPRGGRFISPRHLMDWLNLLNFNISRIQYAIYGLPMNRDSEQVGDYTQGFSRHLNLPIGSIYVIVAQKQVSGLTPISPQWRSSRGFGPLSVVRSVGHAATAVTTVHSTDTRELRRPWR